MKAVHTVIAGDAASATVVSAVKARRLHMIATAPLAERVVDTLVYARYGYEYFQQPPDGRIALGGFSEGDRPFAGQLEDGLYALGGYSGTGNLIGFIAGRAVAEKIATGASSDLDLLAL